MTASDASGRANTLDELLDKLSEEKQEREVEDESSSHFTGINPELLREREREFRDIEKHWVRKDGWLKFAKLIAQRQASVLGHQRGLRYLTLPAYYRIDVSLLLREQLIEVTKANQAGQVEEVYVAAFESEFTKFGRMVSHAPRFKLFGATTVEQALTDPNNEYYHQLRDLFPFDIINLDLTTSLTPRHEGPYSQTFKAIESVFDNQSGYGRPWALFLTFRNLPSDWETTALQQLFENLQANLDQNPDVFETFCNRYRLSHVKGLEQANIKQCISQAVAKWLVDRAHYHKFKVTSFRFYWYSRHNQGLPSYDIYKHILVFEQEALSPHRIPTKTTPTHSWMVHDLSQCIEQHKCIDVAEKLLAISYNGRPGIFEELQSEVDRLCSLAL